MKHLKIKNRARFTFSMFIIFVIIISLFSMVNTKVFSYQEPKLAEITVSYGDTLWSIARKLDGNINENIFNIQKINHLENCNIYEGQKLLVPII